MGRVEAFLADADAERITHVVAGAGHLAHRDYAVPLSNIAGIEEIQALIIIQSGLLAGRLRGSRHPDQD